MPTAVQVSDQELVVHLFAAVDGPQADVAYRQLLAIWSRCRDILGTTQRVPSVPVDDRPPPDLEHVLGGDAAVLAAQQDRAGDRQVILRREHDVVNLSAAIAQPRDVSNGATRPPLGWIQQAHLWSQATSGGTDRLLGEARLYLGKEGDLQDRSSTLPAGSDLADVLPSLLPYRERWPVGLWQGGTTTAAGFTVWDLTPASNTGLLRELLVLAPHADDARLSAWTWTDGGTGLPPLGRYLMHATKLRYHARLLSAWHSRPRPGSAAPVTQELQAVFGTADDSEREATLRALADRLRREEVRLVDLRRGLRELRLSSGQALGNLCAAVADQCEPLDADRQLGEWLDVQAADDLGYVAIDLDRVERGRGLVADAFGLLAVSRQTGSDTATPDTVGPDAAGSAVTAGGREITRSVLVVHATPDTRLGAAFSAFLRAVGVQPLEPEEAVAAVGKATPSISEVVLAAPSLTQAALVVLSPDETVQLHPDLVVDGENEGRSSPELRPHTDVLVQLGLTLDAYPDRTVIVRIGPTRMPDIVTGLVPVRFDGSARSRNAVAERLRNAGCRVDTSGTEWLAPELFDGLTAFQRRIPGDDRG